MTATAGNATPRPTPREPSSVYRSERPWPCFSEARHTSSAFMACMASEQGPRTQTEAAARSMLSVDKIKSIRKGNE